MKERDHRHDAGGAKVIDFALVVSPRGVVPHALRLFDPAPLDRKAISVRADLLHQPDVLGDAIPVVVGRSALFAARNGTRLLF